MSVVIQIQNPVLSPGTGSFTSHSLEIFFICLVMFLLGWLLHRIIYGSKFKSELAEQESHLKSARTRIADLEGDLESCNAAMINVRGENAAMSVKLKSLEMDMEHGRVKTISPDIGQQLQSEDVLVSGLAGDIVGPGPRGFDADGARTVFGKKIKEDDLKIVEGIGPKTEGLLHDSGIHTWRQLSHTSVPQLQNILDKAGDRFQLLNPGTWPKQARMAADGEWIKLREYQDFLVGGVEPEGQNMPEVNPLMVQYIMGKRIIRDDLTIVEGIGPKIQSLLNDKGIKTWRELSESSISRLQEILDEAGDHYRIHDPGTWPKQAGLAHEGRWDALKEYQDFLQRGKDPNSD